MLDLIAKKLTMIGMLLICWTSSALLEQIGLSTKPYKFYKSDSTDIPTLSWSIARNVYHSWENIGRLIKWLEGSELDLVQLCWPEMIRQIDADVQKIFSLINSTATSTEKDGRSKIRPLSKPVHQLAQSVLPIFKLSRLFFNKLSKHGMNRKRLPLFTEMCSDQLKSLADLATKVCLDIDGLLEFLQNMNTVQRNATGIQCNQLAEKIKSCFKSSVLIISFYFVPLIPDTNGLPAQNYYKTATWFLQLNLAMQKFRDNYKWFSNTA
jgi:hypothetical protein